MDYYKKALELHEENMGKWAVSSKVPLNDRDDLSTAYTPGVAQPCREIEKDYENIYRYTSKQNTVAVITDGSAVLGLGNIGADASIPVMEGKAVLFKGFAGIDALPICIKTQDVDEFCNIVKNISSTFGGINLEDISAPRCFEIENRLKRELNIPVFHDDQHGTAVVVSAAAINGLKLIGKKMEDCTAVIAGAGAAGTAIARMLVNLGIKDILVCGRDGILCSSSPRLNDAKRDLLKVVNREDRSGSIHDAMEGADIFIGVSAPKLITADDVRKMADSPVVFAMSNPEPEIMPDEAARGGAAIIGTGRSDFNNQINNVLAFPGIFRGALDARAEQITEEMKIAAAYALAGFVSEEELCPEKILPNAFEEGISDAVAKAVADAWINRK